MLKTHLASCRVPALLLALQWQVYFTPQGVQLARIFHEVWSAWERRPFPRFGVLRREAGGPRVVEAVLRMGPFPSRSLCQQQEVSALSRWLWSLPCF